MTSLKTALTTMTAEQLLELQEQTKQVMDRLKKQERKAKASLKPVEMGIHTSEKGNISLRVYQGNRAAYLNKAQVQFIVDNLKAIEAMIPSIE